MGPRMYSFSQMVATESKYAWVPAKAREEMRRKFPGLAELEATRGVGGQVAVRRMCGVVREQPAQSGHC